MKRNLLQIIAVILVVLCMGGCSDSSFEKITLKESIDLLSSEESSVLYIGRPDCIYCKVIEEPLLSAGKISGSKIYYLDITEYRELPEYKLLEDRLNELLEEGFNYIPLVLVIDEFEIQGYHVGAVESYETSQEKLTSKQRKELEEIYIDLLKKEDEK